MRELLYAGEPNFFRSYLEAKINASEAERARAQAALAPLGIAAPGSRESVDEIYFRDGSDAVIKICGPLSMSGPDFWDRFMGYGGVAYPTIIEAINRAAADPSAERIVFLVNTPGGEVNGADLTWQAHADARKQKKTLCRVSGMLASAGYYAMCPARIEATALTDAVGSIGVIIAYWDFTKAYADMGITRVEIRSKNAPKKAMDGATKAGRDVLQEQVDAYERVFYQRISEARNVTPDYIRQNFGQGALLIARDPDQSKPDALRSKLIDGLAPELGEFPVPVGPGPEDEDTEASDQAAAPATQSAPSSQVSHPAEAGKSSQEVPKMAATLSEFLAQTPTAAAEIEKIKADAKAEARADMQKIGARVGEIITADAYAGNKVIRAKAADVLAGKMSLDSFEAIVATADMQAEQKKSDAAADETESQGETRAEGLKGDGAQAKADAALVAGFFKKEGK